MELTIQGRAHRNSPPHGPSIEAGEMPQAVRLDTLDRTLEQCLLDTQRQVRRLEAIVLRLSAVAS